MILVIWFIDTMEHSSIPAAFSTFLAAWAHVRPITSPPLACHALAPRCGGTCGRAPGYCPQRKNTRADAGGVKSKAGRRTIGLPSQLVALLRAHRAVQQRERAIARQLWHEGGWLFASPTGQPLNPNTDYHEWKRLLKDAGLREARLHAARHTAATVLLALRQPTPTVMSLMGWSSESMAARYQHVTDAMRSQVASQVGDLIWQAAPGPDQATAMFLVRRDSLAVVLAAAEQCVTRHGVDEGQAAGLMAALADLRAAWPTGPESPGTSNEPKTEPRRPAEG